MSMTDTFMFHDILPVTAEAVVVGGGLAGAAAACLLAQAGRQVVVLERENDAVNKICGEFLSAEAQHYLQHIGLHPDGLGGHPVTHLRLVRQRTVVEAALPFRGLGLSRYRLDEAVLNHASQCGADVHHGRHVSEIDTNEKMTVLCADGGRIKADTVFLATGKHDLRSLRRQPQEPPEDLVGFKMHFDVEPVQRHALEHHVELVLLDYGYAGLQRVEEGRVNLCLLVERRWLQACGGTWEGLLHELLRTCPHLHQRLSHAIPLLAKPLSIYRVPYGFIHDPAAGEPGSLYRLGDQAGVIASFSGAGMAIALHSAMLAVNSYLAGFDAASYQRWLRSDISAPIQRAQWLYGLSRWRIGQRLLMALARLMPSSLQLATRLTRVPSQALLRVSPWPVHDGSG